MKKNNINLIITSLLFATFSIFTILLRIVDIGINKTTRTKIGLSSINQPIATAIGTSSAWNTISAITFVLAGLVLAALITIAIIEFAKNKNIFKINPKLLYLIGLYALAGIFYLIFEICIINYRPVLEDGLIKASYPSSHTLLICVICISACFIVPDYIKNKPLKITAIAILLLLSILAPVSRLLSGMHWFTDVVGGIILSLALVMTYLTAINFAKNEATTSEKSE